MIKLIIEAIEGYNYHLIDTNNNDYNINIEFYDMEKNPSINDEIYINKNLLHEINNKSVCFGSLNEIYGKPINEENFKEIICLIINNKKIYLKRFYG